MKPTHTDDFYAAQRIRTINREQHPIAWDVFVIWMIGLAFVVLFWTWAVGCAFTEEDFTDTGVGCVEDCLEPAIQDEAQTLVSQGRMEI